MRAELYWIVDVPQGRRLAIMPRPRGGDWLSDELSSWKSSRVDVVVSLLAVDEVADLGLSQEAALCEALEMIFVSFPIVDRGVPSSGEAFLGLVERLHGYLANDQGVAIHCRMGIGRSSLVAASLLVKSGLATSDAFTAISHARGMTVPDTSSQIDWVESMAAHLRGSTAG